jgi:hypothetical protein
MADRKALVVATYAYRDAGLSQLAAPGHDAEAFAAVLEDAEIAGFSVTTLLNEPNHVVAEAVEDFYADCGRNDLALLYFSGHGLKDDDGRLYLAMANTRRDRLRSTSLPAAHVNDAMDGSPSRRKVLILDCCYSGAFPAGRSAKSDEGVQTLERFQGKGRAVLTASDSTQYAFEGDALRGSGTSSVFTRYLVEAIRSGAADLDEDGDIALDELYSYVRERVVAEMPQQRPKKQEDVDGRILIARNVHWSLPVHLQHAIESPIAAQRLGAVEGLAHLHRVGNDVVRAAVAGQVAVLAADDSRSVSSAASALLAQLGADGGPAPAVPAPTRTPEARTTEPAEEPVARPSRRAKEPSVPSVRPAEPSAPAGPSPGPAQLPLYLSLILVGGVLLLVSRFLVFESTYTVVAADFDIGILWISWLIGAGVPLLIAFQLLVVRGTAWWAVAVAGGLVAGAALGQLGLALTTGSYFLLPDTSELPGPGWWATLLGAVVLLGCVVVMLRRPPLRARPELRSDWRAFSGVLLVAGGLVAWLTAQSEASPWLPFNEPALLLAAVYLPAVVLDLNGAQRLFALATVTVLASWVASGHVQRLIVGDFPVDARATVVVLGSIVGSVAGCYLAQASVRGRSARSTGEPAGHR